jgi:hypothetical protein
MPHYEFLCHIRNRPFARTLTPVEYIESMVADPLCGSEEVEQR